MPFSCIQERLFCYKSICLQSSRETAENIECRIQKYRIQKYRIQKYRIQTRTPNPKTANKQRTANSETRTPISELRTTNSELQAQSLEGVRSGLRACCEMPFRVCLANAYVQGMW